MTPAADVRDKLKGALAFFHHEAAGGLVLMAAALAALLMDNSPLSWLYSLFLDTPVGVRVGPLALDKPLLLWINDGLMAVFFFLVGLEIKREMVRGELSTVAPGDLAGAGGGRRHGGAGADLCRLERRRSGRPQGLGHSGRHRYRLRGRRAGAARRPRAELAQDLPAGAGHSRRPGRDPDHRAVLHRAACRGCRSGWLRSASPCSGC